MSDYTEEILSLVNQDVQLAVGNLLHRLPRHVIQLMVELKLDSKIDIVQECFFRVGEEYKHTTYASWIKRHKYFFLLNFYLVWIVAGTTRDQKDHLVCWEILATELIQAVRCIHRRDTYPTTLYCPQELIDYACLEKRMLCRKKHLCYLYSTL
ncbi:hypothetical protein N665_1178s0007 [Sinapis alba]|nr:hypothetical protein N665_1178s0007 [Sinapis alba]